MEEAITFCISLSALAFSVIFHEMAHAWSALMLGDPTGKNDNRLSWNPVHHIDPFMTIVVPLLTYFYMGFPFGGAKPVATNPFNFKNPGRGMMITAVCGPLSNILLAVAGFGIFYLLLQAAPQTLVGETREGLRLTWNGLFFMYVIVINIVLAVFNLIPVPPLDGSRVLRYLLPEEGKRFLDRIEPFGLFIVVGLLAVGGFTILMVPVAQLLGDLLEAAFGQDVLKALVHALSKGN